VSRASVIVLEQSLLKSEAWLGLRGAAQGVYLIFRTKCVMQRYRGKPGKRGVHIANNGQITFTYKEAASRYKISRGRFSRALGELVGRGFIDVAAVGVGVHKVASCYAISERWRAYGTADFKRAERPLPSIANPGFKRGNLAWQRTTRKSQVLKTDTVKAFPVRVCAHGEILAMRTNAHGEKVVIVHKLRGDKWLSTQIA